MPDQLLFPGITAARPSTDGVFFAVLPDAGARVRIGDLTQGLREKYALTGRPLAERVHVSLQGLGEYPSFPDDMVARAIEAAAAVTLAPFTVAFDRVMSFSGKPGQLPLVLRGEGAAGITMLQQALGAALAKAGLRGGQSAPHLTLLYDARCIDEQPIEPIEWTVRQFVLVHSLLGKGAYKSLGRWPLRG